MAFSSTQNRFEDSPFPPTLALHEDTLEGIVYKNITNALLFHKLERIYE